MQVAGLGGARRKPVPALGPPGLRCVESEIDPVDTGKAWSNFSTEQQPACNVWDGECSSRGEDTGSRAPG